MSRVGRLRGVITKHKGPWAEVCARIYLSCHGLKTVQRNYACHAGEIDIIMLDRQTLVFVEVRMRAGGEFGDAVASVGRAKQKRLLRTAHHFLLFQPQFGHLIYRFDILAIDGRNITWLKNAFEC